MENTYKIDIVSPEQLVFSDEKIQEVVLPSYEGELGILHNHIPLISFLKPGIIKIFKSNEKINSFFVEDGIIEFNNNILTVLSSKITDLKNLKKENINQLIAETEKLLGEKELNDNDRYLANHKMNTLKLLLN